MPPGAIDVPKRTGPYSNTRQEEPSGSPGREGLSGCPIREASVVLVHTTPEGKQIRRPVVLKVYSTSFGGRYAVVSQDKLLSADCGYINLKYCTVDAIPENDRSAKTQSDGDISRLGSRRSQSPEHRFEIISHRNNFPKLVFSVQSISELEQWLAVLCDPEDREGRPDCSSPELLVGSPVRRSLGELTPTRLNSPRLVKKQTLMPALEEE